MNAGDFVRRHPRCCFCGGAEPARTIEHQPSRILFPDRHRPKGLEFPACKACNEQTRNDEALVALMARFAGGHREIAVRDKALLRSARAVEKAFPGWGRRVISQEWTYVNGVLQQRQLIDTTDAQTTKSICRVAAKLALAAYYEHHKAACPSTVKINTMWNHNQHRNARLAVADLLKKTTGTLSLQQGSWKTDDSFFLRYHSAADVFVSIAILHESLALMGLITKASRTENWVPWSYVWKPFPGVGLVPFELQHSVPGRLGDALGHSS